MILLVCSCICVELCAAMNSQGLSIIEQGIRVLGLVYFAMWKASAALGTSTGKFVSNRHLHFN